MRRALIAIVAMRGLMACVDGVTPDCSNPAVCAFIEGDAGPLPAASDASSDSATTPETSTDAASTSDAADAATDG